MYRASSGEPSMASRSWGSTSDVPALVNKSLALRRLEGPDEPERRFDIPPREALAQRCGDSGPDRLIGDMHSIEREVSRVSHFVPVRLRQLDASLRPIVRVYLDQPFERGQIGRAS